MKSGTKRPFMFGSFALLFHYDIHAGLLGGCLKTINLPWRRIVFWFCLVSALFAISFFCFEKFLMNDICSYGGSPYCD